MTSSIRFSSGGPGGLSMTSMRDLGDTNRVKTVAKQHFEEFRQLYNRGQYWDAYHELLRARNLYEKLPDDSHLKAVELIWTSRDLVDVALKIRNERRELITRTGGCCCFNTFFPCVLLPCVTYYCCKLSCGESKWVDDATTASHIAQTKAYATEFIKAISAQYSIKMNTDKDEVPEEARKFLGFAYNQLGLLYNFHEYLTTECCTCCFDKGSVVITRSNDEALTFFRKAMEWDPDNSDYSAHYNKLDAYMKRPQVHVTNVWSSY